MKQNKKALYENIMTSISKEVKKILNEGRVSLQQLFQDSLSGVFQRYDNGELSSLEALRLIRAELDNNIKKMSDLQANKKIKQDLKDLDFNESLYEIVIDLDEPLKGMKSDNRYMNCYFRRVQLMNGDEVYLGYHKSNGLGGLEDDGDYPIGGEPTPIGDPDIYVIISILLLYLFYHIVKSKKIQNVTRN